ncbi:MAG: spermidine synthase [Gammaproteobacteria bacterium]|nr:spermidine synthase [Gammaproteobacteria bacterium]
MQNVLGLIFFLSGVSALIFETLWFRLVGLSLGNSVWSASLVLGAFMAGIALGNALTAGLGSRIKRPIFLYAGLELVIGVVGAALVLALPVMPRLLGPLLGSIADVPWLLNLARLSFAFVLLVIPSTAMGATLPVMVHALTRVAGNFGTSLGTLYGWNTLGAMLGAVASEVLLVKFFGVLSSGLFALALNLAAAFVALRIAEPPGHGVGHVAAPTVNTLTPRGYRYLAVAFASGAIMLAFEVVGFRFLLLSHGGTTLIFAVMLAVVLAGIALGGLVAARLYRITDRAHDWVRLSLALGGLLMVGTYAGFDLFTAQQIRQEPSTPAFVGLAIFLMLPVSLLSGITFTLIGRAVKDEVGTPMRATGIVTLCNTLGAALGALLGGFVLLPVLGMERSFFFLAVAYAVSAVVAPSSARAMRGFMRFATPAAAFALVASLVLFPFGLMQRSYLGILTAKLGDHELVATRESLGSTIRYYEKPFLGEPLFYRLTTDSYSMSATNTDAQRYMKLYVYLPVALRPDMRDALLISFGVGATAKALTDTASLRHIDIVDTSRDILSMSSIIYDEADNPLNDSRVDVHIDDGRFFLNTTRRTYDLITSEPPPPKIAGIASLYSQEYFAMIRSRLRDGGYATYWLPVGELEPLDTLAITRAFCNAFPDCSLWAGAGLDWMLMGSNGAVDAPSLDDFTAQWRDAKVGSELVALGFETPAQMGSLFMADAPMLEAWTANIPPVTDNFPSRISSRLPTRDRVELYDRMMDEDARLDGFRTSAYIGALWPDALKAESEGYFQYERVIKQYLTSGVYDQLEGRQRLDVIDELLTRTSLEVLPLWLLGSNVAQQEIARRQAEVGAFDPEVDRELALGDLANRDYPSALERFNRYMAARDEIALDTYGTYLYTLAKNGRMAEAREFIGRVGLQGMPHTVIAPFLSWFVDRFELGEPDAAPTPPATRGN